MQLFIDNRSSQPIYDQICTQIKNQIISGALMPDDPLPSIRALAKDLRISVITTKRAYEELEREGFIYTVSARGSFVARKNLSVVREANLREIEEHMKKISQLAAACGLSGNELAEMFRTLMEEK